MDAGAVAFNIVPARNGRGFRYENATVYFLCCCEKSGWGFCHDYPTLYSTNKNQLLKKGCSPEAATCSTLKKNQNPRL